MKTVLLSLLLLVGGNCFSQEYSDMWEVYKSSSDFINKKPHYIAEFSFANYYENSTFYNVTSPDRKARSMSRKDIVWGIYKDSTLFLNAKRMGMRRSYVKVRELGKYCHFFGDYVLSIYEQDKLMHNTVMFGLVGTMLTNTSLKKKYDIPYVMKLDVGVPHVMNEYYIEFVLRDYPDLAEQFKTEKNIADIETQLKYIRLVNKK